MVAPRPVTGTSYRFTSRWPLAVDEATAWRLIEASLRSGDPMPWWPQLQACGGLDAVTMTVGSGLGYRLGVVADHIVEGPQRLDFSLHGDIVGQGSVTSQGPLVIRMEVHTTRPWMNRLSWALRPAFATAHWVVMWRGRRKFNRWLVASAG